MATIETALQLFSNAAEKLNSIAEAANKTTAIIEAIPPVVDIEVGGVVDHFNEINDVFNNTQNELNHISEAAEKATAIIEAIPPVVDIGVGDGINQFNEINDKINSVLDDVMSFKRPPLIEAEIEKLEIMSRELENNQSRLLLMLDLQKKVGLEWHNIAEKTGRNSSEAIKLHMEYLKVDKQISTLEKSNSRLVTQMDKQANKLESLKVPVENFEAGHEKLQDITNEILTQSQAIDEQAQKYSSVKSAVDAASGKQNDFKNRIEESSSAADRLNNKIMGYVKSLLGVVAIKKGIENTVGAAGQLSGQVQVMQGMFGDTDVGAAYFNQLQEYALRTGKSIDTLISTTQQFLSVTRNTDKLMALNKISEKLVLKNPTQGFDGAAYAINEALSGQYTSLKNRFNLTAAQLEPIKKAVKQGNLEGIIEAFDNGLNMAGITDDVVNVYRNTVPNQMTMIQNKVKTGFAQAGMSSLKMIEPVLQRINAWLDSDKAAAFFNNISMGINFITALLIGAGEFIVSNGELIKIALTGVGIVLGIMAIQAIAAKAQFITLGLASMSSALSAAAAWSVANWPIILMIILVGVLIAAFIKAGGTTEEVLGIVGGTFGVLWAFIYNGIATVWNIFISFAEFLGNLFIDPVYAIQKLFYDLTIHVLGFFESLFGGIKDGLNWIIGKINNLPGVSIKPIEGNFITETISRMEDYSPKSNKSVYDLSGMKLDYKDYGQSWSSGFDSGYKLVGQVTDIFDGFDSKINNLADFNSRQVDSLGSIDDKTGKIKDSLDIADEELKYFRDIAEREAINQFTTNMVVPQLQANFGDVRETADVNKILERLTEMIQNELAVCAEGVHE